MSQQAKPQGGDLFIVDNSDKDWKVKRYLHDWAEIARAFDIATGYFEIGALLALDGQWQKIDQIRILMGDQVTWGTKKALVKGLEQVTSILDRSIEQEKLENDFLTGVPAIVDALQTGKIHCRIYTKDKFHAKAYITHGKHAVVGSTALVGSSNFTVPGLTDNVELNVQIRAEVEALQQWYEKHWNEAQEVTPEILKTIQRHTATYSPFLIYAKALQEFFRGHEMTVSEWEQSESRMYRILDQYQREGYQALMKIARQYKGAFLCDGVGLGKTYIGLMLIERLVQHDRKRVALFVPKAAREPVWEQKLNLLLPKMKGAFSNLILLNHTDLQRGGPIAEDVARVKEMADVIIIDEAHHFRNPGLKDKSRYWKMAEICKDKTVFLLTATPINNRLIDLQHLIELFSGRDRADYFSDAPLGIHSLPGHFRRMEKALEKMVQDREDNEAGSTETNLAEAEQVLLNDNLFHALVVQRSRAYVKQSQLQNNGAQAIFPNRQPPKVANYSVKKTYGRLLAMVEEAFSKKNPLFSLAVYFPLKYYIGPQSDLDEFKWRENRQKQVVGLIRTQFLKRFESSARAFEMSCQTLLVKLLTWLTRHSEKPAEKKRVERWRAQQAEMLEYVQLDQAKSAGADADEDLISEEMLEDLPVLSRDLYNVEEIIQETFLDLDQIIEFLRELRKFKPSHDDKLRELVKLLKTDPVLKKHKVLIFSEYMDTARYLKEQLQENGIEGVDEVDSASHADRGKVIRAFAPYYNASSSGELAADGVAETRVLISTDVLSEGLNLQDATRLINYDLHWNPVRLMQRIGRVDRRLDPKVEEVILAEHPDQKPIRGTVAYWNFLPPNELDDLLRLYTKVAHKTLRISKTFGIEGKQLLTPEDDFEALREFNQRYEGSTTPVEAMHLEFQRLLKDNPQLEGQLKQLPGKVFSGKQHPRPNARAVFFCYSLPAAPVDAPKSDGAAEAEYWSEESGKTGWYLFDLASSNIASEPSEIIGLIRSTPATPVHHALPEATLADIRKKIEKHIKNTYLKQVQAPVGVKPSLKAWMELS